MNSCRGKPPEKGNKIYSDKAYYEGELKAGMMHGFGKLTSADGVIHEGYWRNDAPAGHGTKQTDTSFISGIFNEAGKASGQMCVK